MKHELIKKIEELDKEFEVHFNKYVADTETRATKYKELLDQNKKDSEHINETQNEIHHLKE